MRTRQRLLRGSSLQLRGEQVAKNLVNGLNINDLKNAAYHRQHGNRFHGTASSRKLFDSIDATSKVLPHTNEATGQARNNAFAMHHWFSIGSWFITVTFDDDNSLLMQILSGQEIDDNTPVEDVPDQELTSRANQRTALRYQFPELTAIHFELLLDTLVKEVIGWDSTNNCPTEKPGLFGECEAVSMAVEEQGIKSLRAHIIIWIKGNQRAMEPIWSGRHSTAVTNRSRVKVEKEVNDILTTKLMHFRSKREALFAFHHEGCSIESYDR